MLSLRLKTLLVLELLSLRSKVGLLMVPCGLLTKFYAQDVWALINNHCLLLRQFLSLLPEDSIIFLAAGSPCPDLTIIGRGQGLLGLRDRSVLIHCVWAVVYYLSLTPFWKRLVILVENAGSTSSSRASRGRKFQKKKELYNKERICL